MIRSKLVTFVAVAAVSLVACGSTDDSTDAPSNATDVTQQHAVAGADVEVGDNHFSPQSVEVSVGDTVTWNFSTAGQPHDVVFDDHRGSDILDSGTWSTSFDEPGTYAYECTLHSGMTGQVVVVTG